MSARKTCYRCGHRTPNALLLGVCGDPTACDLRRELRTERRVSRELRGALTYVVETHEECENADIAGISCEDNQTEYPCAYCAARRGLKRARKARGR